MAAESKNFFFLIVENNYLNHFGSIIQHCLKRLYTHVTRSLTVIMSSFFKWNKSANNLTYCIH